MCGIQNPPPPISNTFDILIPTVAFLVACRRNATRTLCVDRSSLWSHSIHLDTFPTIILRLLLYCIPRGSNLTSWRVGETQLGMTDSHSSLTGWSVSESLTGWSVVDNDVAVSAAAAAALDKVSERELIRGRLPCSKALVAGWMAVSWNRKFLKFLKFWISFECVRIEQLMYNALVSVSILYGN